MDEYLYDSARGATDKTVLCEGLAFVSENLDAFGFVSDAYPVASARCLIAANGYEAEAGAATFTYPIAGGILGLCATLYHGLVLADATTTDILTRTFGKGAERREHPVARYVAALSEIVALRVLESTDDTASPEDTALRLGKEISHALGALRETICRDRITARNAELYSTSLGICRITDRGDGHYRLDLFAAGDYHAYLLDADGLHPLPMPTGGVISPEGDGASLAGTRICLTHPAPFAVLLLSGSACALNALEKQSVREHPGLVWRYRMRLEAHVLRVITSCVRKEEFAARAARFFSSRANGRESASGAMGLRCGDVPFPSFRAECLARLRRLEDIIALLPDGYDPDTVPRMPTRTETEHAYIRRLLTREAGLAERTTDALCALALHRLNAPTAEADIPLPEGVPDYRRLLRSDVEAAFRTYDSENAEDYAAVRQNAAALREYLSEHWVTLRPILLAVSDAGTAPEAQPADAADTPPAVSADMPSDRPCEESPDGTAEVMPAAPAESALPDASAVGRAACDRAYQSILRLNVRLAALMERRRTSLAQASRELAAQALVLRTNAEDWLYGRAGADHPAAWATEAETRLSDALRAYADTYDATEADYRSLLAAYLAERDLLFARDAEREDGAFAAEWTAILEGRMPADRRDAYRAAVQQAMTDGMLDADEDYVALWEDLMTISRGTGARLARIRDRATATRTARDIAARPDIRVAAVRASAYEDADWGEAVGQLLDAAHRTGYFLMVRRWQEGCDLAEARAAAFEEYRAMYEAYDTRES